MAAILAASLFVFSSGALAQGAMYSDGYNFLKAVRDRNGDEATRIVEEPGASTIINTRDRSTGQTALHIVAERRDTAWVRYLTLKGANPNLEDRNGVSPLMISTRLGDAESATALLKAGARVDTRAGTGETPLIAAVHQGDVPLVRLLLEHGADPDRTDNSGRSARQYVERAQDRRLAEALATADSARGDGSNRQYGPGL